MKNNLKIQITIYKQKKIVYNINIIKVKELTLKVLKLKFWRLINMKISEVFGKLNEEQKEVIKQQEKSRSIFR